MSQKTTTTTATITAPKSFAATGFIEGILRDKKRGAAGYAAIKGATQLIDALMVAGCPADEVGAALTVIARTYVANLTDKGTATHREAVRLIAGF